MWPSKTTNKLQHIYNIYIYRIKMFDSFVKGAAVRNILSKNILKYALAQFLIARVKERMHPVLLVHYTLEPTGVTGRNQCPDSMRHPVSSLVVFLKVELQNETKYQDPVA